MKVQEILVHLDDHESCDARLDLAIGLARRHGARLTGLFAQTDPGLLLRGPWRAGDGHIGHATAVEALFRAALAKAGLTADWQEVRYGERGHVIEQTVLAARHADLAVLGQPPRETGDGTVPLDLAEQVILNAGRPVLVVPFIGRFETPGRRVLVAWNAGREAARALYDALPLIAGAERVAVVAFNAAARGAEPPETIARREAALLRHLGSHGIAATVDHFYLGEIGPVDAILSRAADQGDDLLVMGAYGRYAPPGQRPGSVTRGILEQMTLPVLMSH